MSLHKGDVVKICNNPDSVPVEIGTIGKIKDFFYRESASFFSVEFPDGDYWYFSQHDIEKVSQGAA